MFETPHMLDEINSVSLVKYRRIAGSANSVQSGDRPKIQPGNCGNIVLSQSLESQSRTRICEISYPIWPLGCSLLHIITISNTSLNFGRRSDTKTTESEGKRLVSERVKLKHCSCQIKAEMTIFKAQTKLRSNGLFSHWDLREWGPALFLRHIGPELTRAIRMKFTVSWIFESKIDQSDLGQHFVSVDCRENNMNVLPPSRWWWRHSCSRLTETNLGSSWTWMSICRWQFNGIDGVGEPRFVPAAMSGGHVFWLQCMQILNIVLMRRLRMFTRPLAKLILDSSMQV